MVPVAPSDAKLPLAIPLLTLFPTVLADRVPELLATVMSATTLPFLSAVTFTPVISELDVSLLLWRNDNIPN